MTEAVRRVFRLVALVVGIAVMGEGVALAAKPIDATTVKQKVDGAWGGQGLEG